MKKQPFKVGVAAVAAAALIGAGVAVPSTVGAAPAVKANSKITAYSIDQDLLKQIAEQYGIDLSKINFNGITISFPNGTTTDTGTSKPSTGTSKPSTGTTKPSTGSGSTGSTKPSTGSGTTGTTKPTTGTGSGSSNSGSGTTVDQSAYQSEVVKIVNQERASAGLPALTVDALLTKVAVAKAKDMADNKYFSHTSPTYGSPFDMMKSFGVSYSYAGENIAAGQRNPSEVMTAWMNSTGHRENILSKNFGKIGVGYYNGQWVQEFTN
ncbi:CAP domain-containing protein [Paenibacillus sp. FSL H8-0537]|uniref:CAP domain-containing protein n=1 Tax=Paenibacillus sp. FSL H8-0537 TaxID=2921399 RepID=UPI003101381C